jgi:hypothetical protein
LTAIAKSYLALPDDKLISKRDSLMNDMVVNNIPASLLNSCVYAEIRKNSLHRALLFAEYQVLVNPSDANVWDTFGEVYFFMGKLELAKAYEEYVKKIAPDFGGGQAVWEKDLKEYEKLWKQ